MKTIAVVGATGYLGSFVCQSLREQGYEVRYLVRSKQKLIDADVEPKSIREVDFTSPASLDGQLAEVDCVISCLGITRQKDGLSYMDVDYQCNANVLDEAVRSRVKKFIYVSVFRGEQLRDVDLCDAKERFVEYLQQSEMAHCVIRPTGFFSDMKDFLDMARKGRVYLFGDGTKRLNPIHGKDLAGVIVDSITKDETVIGVGGPQVFSHNDIAELAFDSLHLSHKKTYLPDCFRRIVLWAGKRLLSKSTFGPVEFFLTVMAHDMVAPCYGSRTLAEHFEQLNTQNMETNS